MNDNEFKSTSTGEVTICDALVHHVISTVMADLTLKFHTRHLIEFVL